MKHKIFELMVNINGEKLEILSLLLIGLLLIPVVSYGQPSKYDVILHGRYVTAEKFYENGFVEYEHYLFTSENNLIKRYKLSFDNTPQNFQKMSGSDLLIKGTMNFDQINTNNLIPQEISVSEISTTSRSQSATILQITQPASMNSVILLSKYSDKSNEDLSKSYFDDKYFGVTPSESMSQYWKATSNGKFTWNGTTQNWKFLPSTYSSYAPTSANIATLQSDSITLHDPLVDFNTISQVIFVYNEQWANGGYAFAYLTPIPVMTAEGTKNLLLVYSFVNPNNPNSFPMGANYKKGLGVIAHEIGHTFGWRHTQQPPPVGGNSPYEDGWSIMSSNSGSIDGPSGVIGYHKIDAGWINAENIFTVSNGQANIITLDFLNTMSSTNYLVVKVPFGSNSHYYTVEARKDSTFDATPQDQTGLMIYHYSPTGHSGTTEPDTPILLVVPDNRTTDPISDFDNADLDLGQIYTENGVTFRHLSNNASSITVRINNNLQPDISINDVSMSEGNTGTTNFTFSITRTHNDTSVSLKYKTTDNAAISPTDYFALPLASLDFTAGGPLTQTVTISVNGDSTVEPDESFFVDLSNCDDCIITKSRGIGTIQNDDDFCSPPGLDDWIVASSCIMSTNIIAPANVIVQDNSELTIPSGLTLDIDLATKHLLIKSGSKVVIKSGGKIT